MIIKVVTTRLLNIVLTLTFLIIFLDEIKAVGTSKRQTSKNWFTSK
ncbi:hypothetical protein SXYLSMQ121_2425 [Staphylococcus xylosus]|nr:hypothetical protein SXYLSMQ121_2425 [Staphylococcus xylosus]